MLTKVDLNFTNSSGYNIMRSLAYAKRSRIRIPYPTAFPYFQEGNICILLTAFQTAFPHPGLTTIVNAFHWIGRTLIGCFYRVDRFS